MEREQADANAQTGGAHSRLRERAARSSARFR